MVLEYLGPIFGGIGLGISLANETARFAACLRQWYLENQDLVPRDDWFLDHCIAFENYAGAMATDELEQLKSTIEESFDESKRPAFEAVRADLEMRISEMKTRLKDREEKAKELVDALEATKNSRFGFLLGKGRLDKAKNECIKKLQAEYNVVNSFRHDVKFKVLAQNQAAMAHDIRKKGLILAELEPLPKTISAMQESLADLGSNASAFVSRNFVEEGLRMCLEQQQRWNDLDAAAENAPCHNLGCLSPHDSGSSRHAAILSHLEAKSDCCTQGYIEWRSLKDAETATTTSSRTAVETQVRILANVFNTHSTPDARIPYCYGYIIDNRTKRIGLFWSLQDPRIHASAEARQPPAMPGEPLSLSELLKAHPAPTTPQKLEVCRRLASAVHTLHTWRISHKSISASNVLFFPLQGSSGVDLGSGTSGPFLSGFMYARHTDMYSEHVKRNNPEELIYLPAEYLTTPKPRRESSKATEPRFRSAYDLFGLGLVLLEIACWKSVGTFYEEWGCRDEFDFLLRNRAKMDGLVEDQRGEMGPEFVELVSWCLSTGKTATPPKNYKPEFAQKLYDIERLLEKTGRV